MAEQATANRKRPVRRRASAVDAAEVFRPLVPAAGEADLPRAVAQALDRIGGRGRLTVLVNDPQRNTATRGILELLAQEVDFSQVRLLVATGSHGFDAARRRLFERALTSGLPPPRVAWHDCRSKKLVRIGPDGVWRGHRWLLDEGGLLAVGSVEPHYFAGFTGAHKTATVGCAAYADIEANHAAALEPTCRPGRLADNSVHEGVVRMLAALQAVRSVTAINLLQAGGRILDAAAGDPLAALNALIEPAGKVFIRRVEAPADALIAEVSGPLGRSFYQADKGIKNSEWAVRDGGVFVLVAECGDGIGQDQFVALLRQAASYDETVAAVNRQGYRLGDHKAVRLRYLTDPACRAVKVFLVSGGISDAQARTLGLIKAASAADALSAGGIDPSRHRVYRLEDAGNMCLLAQGI